MIAVAFPAARTAKPGRRATDAQHRIWLDLRVVLGFDRYSDRLKTATICEWALGWRPETFRREVWGFSDLDRDDADRVIDAMYWIAHRLALAETVQLDLLAELATPP